MMRYKDEAGTAFAQADSSSDSATSSRSGRPAFSYIQPDADHDSSWPASTSAAFDSDSDSDSAEEATPLQRLQSLAGSWRQQQTRQRRSVARGGVAQTSEAHAGDEAQQAADRAAEPQAAPMQVYVHGIEESKLEAALTKSNLWHRIQVRDSLRVRVACWRCTPHSGLPASLADAPSASLLCQKAQNLHPLLANSAHATAIRWLNCPLVLLHQDCSQSQGSP